VKCIVQFIVERFADVVFRPGDPVARPFRLLDCLVERFDDLADPDRRVALRPSGVRVGRFNPVSYWRLASAVQIEACQAGQYAGPGCLTAASNRALAFVC
jgi:hypothetical protein